MKAGVGEEALDLRAEKKFLAIFVVVEGLDAENIPGAEKFFLRLVPNDKGEHAPKLLQNFFSVFLIAVKNHFRISFCCKAVPLVNQILPKSLIVIDLSVKQQGLGAVFIENGLSAAREIDNGKPPEAQGNIFVHIVVSVVRPPVNDPVRHGVDHRLPV